MADSSSYSRSGGGAEGTQSTPPQGSISNSGSVKGQHSRGISYGSGWQQYAKNGQVTSPPPYPDTSYQAYLKAGGNILGIGYIAWRDKVMGDYQTAYNLYQQWYDSTQQQVSRIAAAGLNTNLAYGMASPGSASGGPAGASPVPTTSDVFGQVAGAFTGFSGGLKTLAEAADIVYRLPESKFKGIMARQLNSAAAAGAINSENLWKESLNSARLDLGLGKTQASREEADNIFQIAKDNADQQLLEYMTTHDLEGSETDFEGSAFVAGKIIPVKNDALAYQKNKLEFDNLFSNPEYFKLILEKMENDNWISKGQAYTAKAIINDPNLDSQTKALMLQGGLPGFLAKLSGMMASHIIDLGYDVGAGVKWLGEGIVEGGKTVGKGFVQGGKTIGKGFKAIGKGFKKIVHKAEHSTWKSKGRGYDPDDYTD